jgi:hypothetical protein
MPKFVANVDLNKNELRNAVLHVLSSAPSSPLEGQVYYNSVSQTILVCTTGGGSPAWKDLGKQGTVTSVSGTSPISVSNGTTTPAISISAADGSNAGSMSAAHYTLVNNATNANTASTIVKRDSSGNFSAGTITAALTGDVTGNVSGSAGTVLSLSGLDTDDLSEGTTNLYYTDTRVRANRLDQMAAPTSAVSLNSQKITNLATPTNATDAATKGYVDAARQGLDVKKSVRAATTGPVTLSTAIVAGQTLDTTVTLAEGDRVLVKDQATSSQNGIYVVQASGAPVRATDANGTADTGEVSGGTFTFVEEGTVNADSGWVVSSNGTITVGTDAMVWSQFSGTGQITAGDGLTKDGNILNVVGTTDRITVGANSVDIASTYVGQNSITTLGTITTGTWSADTIVVGKGGTGATSFTSKGILYGNSTDAIQVTGAGTQYQVLQAGSGGTPTFGALNLSQSAAITGTLPIGNGGTGSTTAAGARSAIGAAAKYKAYVPSGSTTAVITHSLNTTDVVVEVYEVSSGSTVYCDVTRYSADVVNLEFSTAPTNQQYRVVVIAAE